MRNLYKHYLPISIIQKRQSENTKSQYSTEVIPWSNKLRLIHKLDLNRTCPIISRQTFLIPRLLIPAAWLSTPSPLSNNISLINSLVVISRCQISNISTQSSIKTNTGRREGKVLGARSKVRNTKLLIRIRYLFVDASINSSII